MLRGNAAADRQEYLRLYRHEMAFAERAEAAGRHEAAARARRDGARYLRLARELEEAA